jgi:hypothetical protein
MNAGVSTNLSNKTGICRRTSLFKSMFTNIFTSSKIYNRK